MSTRWNAGRHIRGEDMVEEILNLGLTFAELGYDLRPNLVPGVMAMIESGAIRVRSVHNFCPVPPSAPRPHPELYTPGSLDRRERELAVEYITKTVRFAAEVGADVVVVHSGNIDMPSFSRELIDMAMAGHMFSDAYEKLKMKAQAVRDKRAPKQLKALRDSMEKLAPVIRETGVRIALENLPTWEAIPTEVESEQLMKDFYGAGFRCWYDLGHAQIRENIGFINAWRWFSRLKPYMAGVHIHDVIPPGGDHVMPPRGKINFKDLSDIARMDIVRVLEPAPETDTSHIVRAISHLQDVWPELDIKEERRKAE